MGVTITIVVAVLLVVLVVALLLRRKGITGPTISLPEADRSRSTIAPPEPMTDLESALDQVTDRAGRNMRENLEAEAAAVDGLKVADDSEPLLQRALDRLEQPKQPGDGTA